MKTCSLIYFLFLFFLVLSCSSSTEPKETLFDIQGENGFVGTVNGTNAFIALLVADDESIVYVCNGDDEDIAEWFRGVIVDPTDISLTNSAGAQISGQYSGSSFAGNVTLRDSSTFSFTAIPNRGSETGIFRVYGDLAAQDEVVAGWIVNAANEERGSVRVQGKKKKPIRIGDIKDGTSNTVFVAEKSYPFFRFFLQRSSTGSFSIVAPNN